MPGHRLEEYSLARNSANALVSHQLIIRRLRFEAGIAGPRSQALSLALTIGGLMPSASGLQAIPKILPEGPDEIRLPV